MHSVARPSVLSCADKACSRVTRIRAPLAPIGCPRAIAPPLTFTFCGSKPSVLPTARNCAANASLASIRSISESVSPLSCSALCVAGTGPIPINAGATPPLAQALIRAIGFNPAASAADSSITTSAAAPSLMPEALPAVTVPDLSKAGRKAASPSVVESALGNSSRSKMVVFLREVTLTGTISARNAPESMAASALRCESSASSSCISRLMPYSLATFSAVIPI